MNNKILRKAETYRKTHTKKQWLYRVLSVLAAGAVFCTTYALILPAITMEKDPTCGFTEHEHTSECYAEYTAEKTFSCLSDLHKHEESCFDSEGNILCGYSDYVVHTHNEFCFDESGGLICELPEIAEHIHNEKCFAVHGDETEDHVHTEKCYIRQKGELLCGIEESDGHTHDEKCNGVISKTLVCEKEESEAHEHTDGCYETIITDHLLCGLEESEGHSHTESCFNESGDLICGLEESEGHFHSDECYEQTQHLVCELSEEGHIHDENCYEIVTGNICGMEESEGHIHNDDCYEWTETLICEAETEDAILTEDTEPEAICGFDEIILHEHTEECFDAEGNLICGQIQVLEHIHSEECFAAHEPELICGLEEHTHDEILCYIDTEADIENADDWEATLPTELSGDWASDLISVAQSQLDYTESETNVLVDAKGEVSHYSRYGAWYGRPYAEWNQIFLSFCLSYAGIPEEAIPQTDDTEDFISAASEMGILQDSDYSAQVGDIAILCDEYGINTVGIVTDFVTDENDAAVPVLISGDVDGAVVEDERADEYVVSYVSLAEAYNVYYGIADEEVPEDDTQNDTSETENEEVNVSEDAEINRNVSVVMSCESVNDETWIVLEAVFDGIDPSSYLWQWQTSYDGISDWMDIAGAADIVYSFPASDENLAMYYRIYGTKYDDTLAAEPAVVMFSMRAIEEAAAEDETDADAQDYVVSDAVTPVALAEGDEAIPDDGKYYIYFYDFERDGHRKVAYTSDGIDEGATGTVYIDIVAPDGYQWDGKWYLDEKCTVEYEYNFTTPVSSMTEYLQGEYERDLYLYPGAKEIWNVVFISYGSYIIPLQLLRTETFDINVYKPTRTGYTFDGWYSDEELTEEASGTQTCPEDIAEGNYTVYYYAKWSAGYVPFNAMLRTENANDTNFTQAEGLGTWYALAGSTIQVKTSGTTHEVVCVLDGKEYPVYTSDPVNNPNNASQATLEDVYKNYFVFNNSDSNEWTEVFGESQVPYTPRPISSSKDNPTVVNFDYMRVRVDVTFNISNGNRGGYIDIYKLVQNGTLTGTVTYTGTPPTSTGKNVSASGVTADDGIAWKYTAASGTSGTNQYVLKDVKYGQRFADAYPVGGTWVTAKWTSRPFRTWQPSSGDNQTSLLTDLTADYMANTGRNAAAKYFTASFENDYTVALMYAIECLPDENADFTVNNIGYKVAVEYCEILNAGNNWNAKELAGCQKGTAQLYSKRNGNLSGSDATPSATVAQEVYEKYWDDYYANSTLADEISDLDYAYIFYYRRQTLNVAFDFNYDNDNDSQNEVATYKNLLYGQSLTSYQYAMSDGSHHALLTRDGYRFLGWMDDKGEVYTDEDWGNMKLIGSEGSTMTFYAKWEQLSTNIVQYYETISSTEPFEWHFFKDGSTVPYPKMVVYPDSWVWTNRQVGSQRTFDWNVPMYGSNGVPEELTIDGKTQTYNVIKIYGKWDTTAVKVGYDANVQEGGIQANAPVDSESYELGDTKVPVKAMSSTENTLGKVFVGWKLDKNGLVYQPGDHVGALWMPYMTFIAQWAAQEDVVKLIYDPNGGTPDNLYNEENSYARGATTTVWNNMTSVNDVETAHYTRDGYEFIGWNTSADGSGTAYAPGDQITLTADVTTLYAQWRPTDYTLTIEKYYNAANDSSTKIPLADAEFELYSIVGTTETQIGNTLTSGSDGTVTVPADENGTKLQIGTLYKLIETKAPDGFILLTDPIYFRLTTDGKLEFCDANGNSITTPDYVGGTYNGTNPDNRLVTISVMNKAGYELPETGGIGTLPYTLGGLMIVGASGILFMYKTRRKQRG